eukprot:3090145-Amphidinium_carterae.1
MELATGLTLQVALRLWDMLLIEGETAIFALLLVLLARLVPEVPAEVPHNLQRLVDLGSQYWISQNVPIPRLCQTELHESEVLECHGPWFVTRILQGILASRLVLQ